MRPTARAFLAAALGIALAAVTALIALDGGDPASPFRHGYLPPVVVAALRWGAPGGAAAAGAAMLLLAPVVLPEIERSGLTPEAVEGLVTLATVALVGALLGARTTRARRLRARYETILAAQRALAGEAPLELALARLRAVLTAHLHAADVGLVVSEGGRLVTAGGDAVAPGSVAAEALAGGPIFVADAGGGRRPRRVFAAPLGVDGARLGALAVERLGEIGADERAALEALGAHIGLALENARLASRQRRFAEELEAKVAHATRRLEELDRAKSSFVAVASHELRTPLTALQGFSEILALRRLPGEEVSRLAGIMRGEARRLGRIVNDLLDLSRIERGLAPTLRREPVAVETLIASVAEVFRRGSATHPIVVGYEAGLPRVDADPDALERILTNLVSNALKYSPPGRLVRIRARAAARGASVEIEVEDQGPGIPDESLARIFEPYYRAPESEGAARGTGIGLAVVKSLVEAHGGSIRVESTPGAGTRVLFSLPACVP
ncbi:MAG TPA: HAMP domain-containing sensor histidine kinase [Methylomirabilota bacterium]|nr:HAMP domain-containing sensor histidine kinase [Methylomirabilota bacterium]